MAALNLMTRLSAVKGLMWSDSNRERIESAKDTYPQNIGSIRQQEYPILQGTVYLDHAGTTLYAKSMIESYTKDLTSNIFGNPHSNSTSSQSSSNRIADVRLKVLKFVKADPDLFDVVFVANATAAIKLVADAFRDSSNGFWYGYHADSHNSVIGVRELAALGSSCFYNDEAVKGWISDLSSNRCLREPLMLFAYPGQSNMTGHRPPTDWCSKIRTEASNNSSEIYTLLDAAALASTSSLDLSDTSVAADFTALSFYKIFGFPDLGALIVRKASSNILRNRKYFGGGSVDVVSACDDESWHIKKSNLHGALEDGTLPFHNIVALDHALEAHARLFGTMDKISIHVANLRSSLYSRMVQLTHSNGNSVCEIYSSNESHDSLPGPIIAFNLLDASGNFVSPNEVEKLAIVNNIQLRTGGFCNPGGVARHLNLTSKDVKSSYAAGHKCGSDTDLIDGKPLGAIRVSLGAMSSDADVESFIIFLDQFYVDRNTHVLPTGSSKSTRASIFQIDSMAVFPIKSCAAFSIPPDVIWQVSSKGLEWDREWCLMHQGTNIALNQKQYPRMALIQPNIDLKRKVMTISSAETSAHSVIEIALDEADLTQSSTLATCDKVQQTQSMVCGESVSVQVYCNPEINDFFSDVLGTPCALARYSNHGANVRLAKLRQPKLPTAPGAIRPARPSAIKLSNESPILLVNQSSVNKLNAEIRQSQVHSEEILSESFRANIVVSEQVKSNAQSPYAEDSWKYLSIGSRDEGTRLDVLGPCRRCQMVCVDQSSAKRRSEPFSTLTKTRRWGGGVWFGIHLCLGGDLDGGLRTLRVGDVVVPS